MVETIVYSLFLRKQTVLEARRPRFVAVVFLKRKIKTTTYRKNNENKKKKIKIISSGETYFKNHCAKTKTLTHENQPISFVRRRAIKYLSMAVMKG